ncbi:MAG TPA: MASE3 domain-containing protein, partial [Rectinemataceae bacterium]|nr:MASE3 domain-containing protein [Rectinemataceae bacterium]
STYFVIAWHTRRINESPSIAALGIAYLFVAILDVFHTLAYQGMGVFTGYSYPANQVWVVARLMEALSLLGFSFVRRLRGRGLALFIGAYIITTAAGLASIFIFRIFPVCFVAGLGQTRFKMVMEAVVISVLVLASLVLWRRRGAFPGEIYENLQLSVILTAVSEFAFTLYVSNSDWVNMTGHLLKIASFYLVYRSIVVTGLERPQELLYSRLKGREEELRRANEAKDTLISILGHDLRSPLAGIQGVASMLATDPSLAGEGELGTWLKEIAKSAGSSLELAENVLSWARCQSGELLPAMSPVNPAKILRTEAELLKEAARSKGVCLELVASEPPSVLADPNMLSTIVRNMLQNAVKFTPSGGRVVARATGSSSECVVEVEDTGTGMDEDELGRLFRVDGRLRGVGTAGERGTGFGLVVASEFSRKMGARLEVKSAKGIGSTFRIRIPRSPVEIL